MNEEREVFPFSEDLAKESEIITRERTIPQPNKLPFDIADEFYAALIENMRNDSTFKEGIINALCLLNLNYRA